MLNRVGSLKLFALAGFIGALFVGGCGRKPTQPTVVYVTVTPTPTPVPTGTPQRCGFTVALALFNPATMKCLNGPYQVRVLMNVTATGTETITITQIRYLDAVCRAPAGGRVGSAPGASTPSRRRRSNREERFPSRPSKAPRAAAGGPHSN